MYSWSCSRGSHVPRNRCISAPVSVGGVCATPEPRNAEPPMSAASSSAPTFRNLCLMRPPPPSLPRGRSEEHTSELQLLMRHSYAVFCLKKKKTKLIIIPKKHQTQSNGHTITYTPHNTTFI